MGHTLDLDQFTEDERKSIQALVQYFGQRSAKSMGLMNPPINELFTWEEVYDWLHIHAEDEYNFGLIIEEDY